MERKPYLKLDGSQGGGGQVLRTALSLSAITGTPFEIDNIRSNRPTPGLAAQHLTCVQAAAQACNAQLDWAVIGSCKLRFEPGEPLAPGSRKFNLDCGTAGSTVLIAQTLLPIVLFSGGGSLQLTGGTENEFAPTSLYFKEVFLPLAAKLGVRATANVKQFGWFPKGAGKLEVDVEGVRSLHPFDSTKREGLDELTGLSVVSNLDRDIAQRMKTRALKNLSEAGIAIKPKIDLVDAPSIGVGAEFFLKASYEGGSIAGFSSLGEKAKPSEKVAGQAVHDFLEFHKGRACVDVHAADQLLLYAALSEGKSAYLAQSISRHLLSNMQAIMQFLPDCQIVIDGNENERGTVKVSGVGFVHQSA